jgi:hypothetical protein
MGDGIYNFVKVIFISVKNVRERSKRRRSQNRGKEETVKLLASHLLSLDT